MKKMIHGFLLIVLATLLLVVSMPPLGIWPLAPFGFTIMLLVQHRIFPKKVHWLAPALFISTFLTLTFILNYGFSFKQISQFYPVIFVLMMVLAWLLGRKGLNKAVSSNYRYLAFEAALAWVSIDYIRTSLPMFGTTGFIGYSLYRVPWLIQPISYVGIYSLNFVIVLFGYALGMILINLYDRHNLYSGEAYSIEKPAKFWMKVSSVLLMVWSLVSVILYIVPEKSETVKVAALQPNTSHTEPLVDMTKEAASMGAQIVVWPEGAFIEGNIKDDSKGKFARDLAKEQGIYLIVVNFIKGGYKGTRNESIVINPNGEILGISGKDHPLKLLGEAGMTKPSSKAFETAFGKIGSIIGYDLLYMDTSRKLARNGVGLVLAPANEKTEIFDTCTALAIFRAVENKFSIVKAETWCKTLFVNSKGRIISRSVGQKGDTASIIMSKISVGKSNAPQTKWGDWIGKSFLIGIFIWPFIRKLIR